MSKKLEGKPCTYCLLGKSTKNGDHIFPRKLFIESQRGHLAKVPCCKECNDKKSRLEQYLLTVLPFGASHADALENLTLQVPARLAQNISLHKKLYEGQRIEYTNTRGGILTPSKTVPLDAGKLLELFDYITRALVRQHFGVEVSQDDLTKSTLDLDNIDSFINGKVKNKVVENLGNGTVIYTGVQAIDNDKVTAWEYSVYGGLQFGDCPGRKIITLTGPIRVLENVKRRQRFGI